MKNIVSCVMVTCLLLIFSLLQVNAITPADSSSLVVSYPEVAAKAETGADTRVKVLLQRLNEIKTIDKSILTPSDKKKLRIEVRSIRHKFRETYRELHLSVGSLIMTELMLRILF
jgi:hypothetical protein